MASATSSRPPDTWLGVDLGSGGCRIARFNRDTEKPEIVRLGYDVGPDGTRIPSFRYPPDVVFQPHGAEKPGFEFLGYQLVTDPDRTSSGLKQSLDPTRLCGSGTRGHEFLKLCEQHGMDNWDILREQLRIVRKYTGDASVRVNFAIPATWARGEKGIKIQQRFRKHAVEAGFSDKTLGFDTEPGALAAYLAWDNPTEAARKVLIIDMGAGTLDCGFYQLENGRTLLLRSPIGCGGGIDDVKSQLRARCRDNESLFHAALEYLYRMPSQDDKMTKDFCFDEHCITREEFQEMMDRCLGRVFKLIEQQLRASAELDEVIISGGAPTSNPRLREMVETLLENCRGSPKSAFKVRFLEPDEARFAVCMGAAIPYALDAAGEFRANAFGFLLQMSDRSEPVILGLKEHNSDGSSMDWVSVRLRTPDELVIEPHAMRPDDSEIGRDEGLPCYSQDRARPMRRQTFSFKKSRERSDSAWVHFERKDCESNATTALILRVQCGKHRYQRRLELGCDRDGLFLSRARRRGRYSGATDIDEETDEKESNEGGQEVLGKGAEARSKRHEIVPAQVGRNSRSHKPRGRDGFNVNGEDRGAGAQRGPVSHSDRETNSINGEDRGAEAQRGPVSLPDRESESVNSEGMSAQAQRAASPQPDPYEFDSQESDRGVLPLGDNLAPRKRKVLPSLFRGPAKQGQISAEPQTRPGPEAGPSSPPGRSRKRRARSPPLAASGSARNGIITDVGISPFSAPLSSMRIDALVNHAAPSSTEGVTRAVGARSSHVPLSQSTGL